ncbi:MAG: ABC transporter permease [Solobacterium sp.]|uniref:ABC transporter permease n=1 Tax=Solobacterium sp. TaxID=2060878 RepID=UPI001CB4F3FC|nr:ABC transporter permease [Solobacterium sp.]MBF1089768.1 ABC transporter permease [Solobacterium sp.]
MKWGMAFGFAKRNLHANRLLEIPFVLSIGIMFLLFNIMVSLLSNQYVLTRHADLPSVIQFGVVMVAIFAFIFVMYANGFLIKRRNKEFALYGILGLEKKHIRKILFIEYFVLFICALIIGVIGGYIFGKVTFIALNYLLKDTAGSLMDYPFSIKSCVSTAILAFVLFVITLIRNNIKIYLATPVQLLGNQHKGEGEPKNRYLFLLLGFILLGAGYAIALTVQGILSSLVYFFSAALLVLFGTYLLYISFSIFILKLQRGNEKYYYKPTHFLSVSGLLYRMQANAVSLASVSILSTGVLITLSATAAIYSTIQKTVDNVMPREYLLSSDEIVTTENKNEIEHILYTAATQGLEVSNGIEDDYVSYGYMTSAARVGNELKVLKSDQAQKPYFMIVSDLASYNKRTHQQIELKDNEILMCTNQKNLLDLDQVKIGDVTYTIHKVPNFIPSTYAVESYGIIAKDFTVMKKIGEVLQMKNIDTGEYYTPNITANLNWNLKSNVVDKTKYFATQTTYAKEHSFDFETREATIKKAYELNGGFLFLGILIGIIFIVGTVLITYYKQINEGYEDRDKFQIMKKVGLPDQLIHQTSNSQVLWLFLAPLAVATLHSLVASKIVSQLLGLFAVNSYMEYAQMLFAVIGIFFIVYFVIFRLTSRAYYRIVH